MRTAFMPLVFLLCLTLMPRCEKNPNPITSISLLIYKPAHESQLS